MIIDDALRGTNCFPVLDDVLVTSTDLEMHLKDMHQIFRCLRDRDLVHVVNKCVFCVSEILFLGWTVSKKSISPFKEEVDSLFYFPQPENAKTMSRCYD